MGKSNRSGGNSDPIHLLPDENQVKEMAKLEQVVADAKMPCAEEKNFSTLIESWVHETKSLLGTPGQVWRTIEPIEVISGGGATIHVDGDGTCLCGGKSSSAGQLYS